ncbi:MAG: hypothetical protein AAGC56_04160 [Pseudomonadota bacterium]
MTRPGGPSFAFSAALSSVFAFLGRRPVDIARALWAPAVAYHLLMLIIAPRQAGDVVTLLQLADDAPAAEVSAALSRAAASTAAAVLVTLVAHAMLYANTIRLMAQDMPTPDIGRLRFDGPEARMFGAIAGVALGAFFVSLLVGAAVGAAGRVAPGALGRTLVAASPFMSVASAFWAATRLSVAGPAAVFERGGFGVKRAFALTENAGVGLPLFWFAVILVIGGFNVAYATLTGPGAAPVIAPDASTEETVRTLQIAYLSGQINHWTISGVESVLFGIVNVIYVMAAAAVTAAGAYAAYKTLTRRT